MRLPSIMLVTLLVSCSFLPSVLAQSAHRRIPQQKPRKYQDLPWKGDPETILSDQITLAATLKQLTEKFFDLSDPSNPKFNFGKLTDKAALKKLKKIADQMPPNTKLTKKKLEEIKKHFENLQDAKKNIPPDKIPVLPQPPPDQPNPPPFSPPNLDTKPPPEPPKSFQDRLIDSMKGFFENSQLLDRSPALRQFVQDMQLAFLDPSQFGKGESLEAIAKNFPALDGFDISLPDIAGRFGNMSPPAMPKVRVSFPRMGRVDMPDIPINGTSSGWAMLQFVLWSVFGIVVVSLLFVFLRKFQFNSQTAASGWNLGPWPVDPSQITTQEEFVQAFDYLAVLLLGPQVRTSNHRDIAEQLAAKSAQNEQKRRAVDDLSDVYERARYARLEQPITADTRRQLQFVAGMNIS